MMFAINKENFEGHREVTCCSCHHGAAKLVPMPVISDEEKPATMAEATGAAEDESAANLPTPDEILGKYIRALSGASASGGDVWATSVGFVSPLPVVPSGHYTATLTFTVIGR